MPRPVCIPVEEVGKRTCCRWGSSKKSELQKFGVFSGANRGAPPSRVTIHVMWSGHVSPQRQACRKKTSDFQLVGSVKRVVTWWPETSAYLGGGRETMDGFLGAHTTSCDKLKGGKLFVLPLGGLPKDSFPEPFFPRLKFSCFTAGQVPSFLPTGKRLATSRG